MESKGAQIFVEEPREQKRIIYWFDWAAVLHYDRNITFKHRHDLKYKDARKRRGCSKCGTVPPQELKSIAMLQQMRKRNA